MLCAQCKYDFCWVCLEPWKKHSTATGGYFRCNRYEIVRKVEEQQDLLKTEVNISCCVSVCDVAAAGCRSGSSQWQTSVWFRLSPLWFVGRDMLWKSYSLYTSKSEHLNERNDFERCLWCIILSWRNCILIVLFMLFTSFTLCVGIFVHYIFRWFACSSTKWAHHRLCWLTPRQT